MNGKEHWEKVWWEKSADDVSWFQTRPATSLHLIKACGSGTEEPIIDVGGGASVLVDCLLGAGFSLLEQMDETHVTPWGTEQTFSCFHFARIGAAGA